MAGDDGQEGEWVTRKRRIDPKLKALGWEVVPLDAAALPKRRQNAIEELATANRAPDCARGAARDKPVTPSSRPSPSGSTRCSLRTTSTKGYANV